MFYTVITYKSIVAAVFAFAALIGFFINECRRADKEFEKERKKKEMVQSKFKPMQAVKIYTDHNPDEFNEEDLKQDALTRKDSGV